MAPDAGQLDALEFALLVAHQLQSPISAAGSIIKSLLGGYQGPLTEQQRDYISRANARCDQAVDTIRRMLAIARAIRGADEPIAPANMASLARQAHQRHQAEADERGIAFDLAIEDEPAYVRFSASALTEALEALLSNAFKYTPDNGQVRLRVALQDPPTRLAVAVADSGVGIAPEDLEKVFQPYYRTATARGSSTTGTGLGLMFVRSIVQAAGGTVRAQRSDLGGAEIVLSLPVGEAAGAPLTEEAQQRGQKVVIIGGVAAGPKVASKVIRLDPHADVTIIEKGKFLSYAGCGLPYYVSGVVKSQKQLMSTPAGLVRDAVFFQKVRNVHVRNDTQALKIDRAGKRVLVRDLLSGLEDWLEYDKLVLATGAEPIVPHIEGVERSNVFTLHGVHDAEGIKAALAQAKARDVVVAGGGLLGLEFTGSLAAKGCRVTIVEKRSQIMPILDEEMALLVERHLESHGVRVLKGASIVRLEGGEKVTTVVTEQARLPADLVVLAIGVRPNSALAAEAGLEIGPTGGIKTDEHLRTSDASIFAAGDCVQSRHLVTGKPCYMPMGSLANKQGRVVAVNLCGGDERFPGVLGSTVCQVFDYCVARTGLTEADARKQGLEVVTALAAGPDAEHFMPVAKPLMLKLIADARTRKLLGAQGIGPGRADKRIDVAAMAISAGMTIDQVANADLCYAPGYALAMDNIITAANIVRNKLAGYMVGVSSAQVQQMLAEQREFLFLDVRTPAEYEQERLPGSTLMPLGAMRGRLEELPRSGLIVTFDSISLRAYEAALILRAHGFADVRVLEGGMEMWPYQKLH